MGAPLAMTIRSLTLIHARAVTRLASDRAICIQCSIEYSGTYTVHVTDQAGKTHNFSSVGGEHLEVREMIRRIGLASGRSHIHCRFFPSRSLLPSLSNTASSCRE